MEPDGGSFLRILWRQSGTKVGVVLIAGTVAAAAGTGLAGASGPGPSATPAVETAAPTAAQPAAVGDAEAFVAVSPTRVLDTRGPAAKGPIGVATAAPLGAGAQLDLTLTSPAPNRPTAPLPADAVSAVLNITIDQDASAKSFVTVWPTGEPRPLTSANNAEPGAVTPNLTIARLGTNGSVSFFNLAGATNLAVDLVGYTVPLAAAAVSPTSLGTTSTPVDLDATFRPIATFTAPTDGTYVLDGSTSLTKTALLSAGTNPTLACKWTTAGGDAGPTFQSSMVAGVNVLGVGTFELGSSTEVNALGQATLAAGQTADLSCNAAAGVALAQGAVQTSAVAYSATRAG